MPRYFVRMHADTPACVRSIPALSDPKAIDCLSFEFSYPDQTVSVALRDNYGGSAEVPEYRGLLLDVECTSATVDDATEMAMRHGDSVLTLVALATACYVAAPSFQFAYDVSAATEVRQYVRHVLVPEVQRLVQRPVRPETIDRIFTLVAEHMSRVGQLPKKKREAGQAVHRALRWIRKGLGDDDALDAFIDFWIALEALDYALPRGALSTPPAACTKCGKPLNPCPYCHKNSGAYASTTPLLGVVRLCREHGVDETQFRRLRNLRAAVLHAREPLTHSKRGVVAEVKRELPTVRRLAILGAAQLLHIPSDMASRMLNLVPVSAAYETWLRIDAHVTGVAVPSERPIPNHQHPVLHVAAPQLEHAVTADGKLKVRQHCRIEPTGCSVLRDYPWSVEVWSKAPLESVEVS